VRKPQSPSYFSVTSNKLFAVWASCTVFPKNGIGSLITGQVFENCIRTCVIYQGEFMVLEKKLGTVVFIAFIAYHTPPLMSYSGILWINVALSADQYHLLWGSIYPLRWNKISSLNKMNVGLISTSCTLWGTSSQYLVLLRDLCRRFCGPQLSYMNANAVASSLCMITRVWARWWVGQILCNVPARSDHRDWSAK
jgi:hypothetical protein